MVSPAHGAENRLDTNRSAMSDAPARCQQAATNQLRSDMVMLVEVQVVAAALAKAEQGRLEIQAQLVKVRRTAEHERVCVIAKQVVSKPGREANRERRAVLAVDYQRWPRFHPDERADPFETDAHLEQAIEVAVEVQHHPISAGNEVDSRGPGVVQQGTGGRVQNVRKPDDADLDA